MTLTIDVIICGILLTILGIAFTIAVIRLSISDKTASSINGMLSMIESTISKSTSIINGISVGNISDTSLISVETSNSTASIIFGKLLMTASTTVITQSTSNGIAVGNKSTIAVITSVISPVNVSISVGSIVLTASISEPTTVGNTLTMLSTTGITFLTAPAIASARALTITSISAAGFPRPAKKFCHAAPKDPKEPSMVSPASRAVVPVIPSSC